jgi:predicted RNA-binding Zn ribbon-like protein
MMPKPRIRESRELMNYSPFHFDWYVDQEGYRTEFRPTRNGESEFIEPRGGPRRYHRPLEHDSLWLRFAEGCRSREGVLQFVGEFGLLRDAGNSLDLFTNVAGRLWAVAERLLAGERRSAAAIFVDRRSDAFALPMMHETILWSPDKPEVFELAVIPRQLEDALKHQAAEAITGNRHFRRCRNEGCANWFRLGPRAATEGRARTFTARREFCSDRCRVAHARRQRREATNHA